MEGPAISQFGHPVLHEVSLARSWYSWVPGCTHAHGECSGGKKYSGDFAVVTMFELDIELVKTWSGVFYSGLEFFTQQRSLMVPAA